MGGDGDAEDRAEASMDQRAQTPVDIERGDAVAPTRNTRRDSKGGVNATAYFN